jgi:hypothetical protein
MEARREREGGDTAGEPENPGARVDTQFTTHVNRGRLILLVAPVTLAQWGRFWSLGCEDWPVWTSADSVAVFTR